MSVSPDLLQGQFAVNQSDKMPVPNTIASAATVAPTTRITFLTGTVQLATITPPLAGQHQLVFVFTNAAPGAFLTTGNIQRAFTPLQNIPVYLEYDPVTAKYWVGGYAS